MQLFLNCFHCYGDYLCQLKCPFVTMTYKECLIKMINSKQQHLETSFLTNFVKEVSFLVSFNVEIKINYSDVFLISINFQKSVILKNLTCLLNHFMTCSLVHLYNKFFLKGSPLSEHQKDVFLWQLYFEETQT